MGVISALRELYLHLEDRYYEIIDRISTKIPINKITDAIDKVFPSFLLLIILALVLIAALVIFFLPISVFKKDVYVNVFVQYQDRFGAKRPLEGANVEMLLGEKVYRSATNTAGTLSEAIAVKKGDSITLRVSKEGFKPNPIEKSVLIEEDENVVINFLLTEIIRTQTVSFRILDENNKEPIVQRISLSFECSNKKANPPADAEKYTTHGGEVQIDDVEIDCLPLIVTLSTRGYEAKEGVRVTDGSTILLKKIVEMKPPEQKGKIIVNVTFKGQAPSENIIVDLEKDTGATPVFVESGVTSGGQVLFEVLPGSYRVKTKATTTYTSAESQFITIGANEYRTVSLELTPRYIGSIKIQVVDKTTSKPLEGAKATLFVGNKQYASADTNSEGRVDFHLCEDINFLLVINHPDYCVHRLTDVRKSEGIIKLELQPYANDCGGLVIVKVVDSQGISIPNAKVAAYDSNGNALGLKEMITDMNGRAEFKGLYAGKYKFFAYKGFGSNWSDVIEFIPRLGIEQEAIIVLDIPKATLKLKVTNTDDEALPFSDVIVKDAYTDKVIKGPLKVEKISGELDINIDAGLSFYLFVSHPEYATYISQRIVLAPNEQRSMNIRLEAERISGEIKIEFLGLFKDEKNVMVLAAGKEYIAKFKISVPRSAQYDRFGAHVRVGKYNIMEKDFIFIKEVYAGGNPKMIRGTSYNPEEGTTYDLASLSAESSKWINLEWSKQSDGIIYVYVKVKVKESAAAEELSIMWRAWGLRKGILVRDPEDITLGNALSDRELYAKTYERVYSVGEERLCTEKWCTVFKALDIEENVAVYIDRSYSAKVGKQYRLIFSITNNSKFETDSYSKVKLKIFNSEKNIVFSNYEIYGETVVKGTANASETSYIEIGDVKPNTEIHGYINFSPTTGKFGGITIRLHDPTRFAHVFEETIFVDIIAAKSFIIDFKVGDTFQSEAPILTSGVENKIIARIRDKQTNLEVSDVLVKIKDPNGNTMLQTTTTSLGLAEVKLPALMPGEKLVLTAEKPDYEEAKKEIFADGNVLGIEPSEIGLQLNVVSKTEDSAVVRLVNKTAMPLKVYGIKLSGDFYGAIDERKVRDWLVGEYVGKEIKPHDKLDIALKVSLSDFGKTLTQAKTLEGILTASVSSVKAFGHVWNSETKVKISIGLGGEVEDPSCLVVSIKEWKTKTKSNEVSTDFSVKNNCTVDGKPIDLKNLSARIEWQSNRVGDYYVSIGDVALELSGSYPKIIKGTFGAEEEISALLKFLPDAGITGTAKAKVIITGEHYTNAGKQVLSASIDTEIEIISLEDCIRFDKTLVRIVDYNEATIKIETKECKVPIDFMLDTKIAVSEKEFTMKPDDSKEIIVMPSQQDIPGQYPIYVMVKSMGESQYSFKKLIRVIIEPDGCLRLNRYEFDIYDDENNPYDGFDTALLINDCYKRTETITISYDERDWWEAIKTGAIWGLVGFVYGGVRSLAAGKTFFGTPIPSNVCNKAGYKYCGTKNLCKDEKIVVVDNITCCASECITEEARLDKEWCKKKGYTYCGPGNCDLSQGKEVVVEGVVCCTGKCKDTKIETPEKVCTSAGKYFCKEDELCPDAAYAVVGNVTCCSKQCVKESTKPPTGTTRPTVTTSPIVTSPATDEEMCKTYYLNSRRIQSYEECYPDCTFSMQTAERFVLCCKNDCAGPEQPTTGSGLISAVGPKIPGCYSTEIECAAKAWNNPTISTGGCDCYAAITCIYDEFGKCYRFGYCNNSRCGSSGAMSGEECIVEGYYCEDDKLYWKDSCGKRGIFMDCGATGAKCYNGQCVSADIAPSSNLCFGCYDTLAKCQKAYGSGLSKVCDCELAVTCEYDVECSKSGPCYKFKSCNNSFCNLSSAGKTSTVVSTKLKPNQTVMVTSAPVGFFSLESIGSLLQGGLNVFSNIINIDDPWTGALIGFIAGTLYTYWQQSQNVGVLEVVAAVRDLNITDLQLVIQKGLEEEIETLISVQKGDSKVETTPDKPLGFEKIEIIFKNNGIQQEDIYKPIYRVLRVDGNRLEYDTNYDTRMKKDAEAMKKMEPTVIGGERYLQKFHLQFNSHRSKPTEITIKPEVSCKVGALVGSTGKEALPKIKLAWNWKDIAINECDEGGLGYYCDATQLSIELLKKIRRIDELLRGQKLKCPSAEGILNERSQELDSLKLDVAVTKIKIEKSGANAKVIGIISSNNKKELTVNVSINVVKDGSTLSCPEGEKAIKVIDDSEVSCTFNELAEGLYEATIRVSPQLSTCPGTCKNENLGNDILSTRFSVGAPTGIFEKCEPYTTERLAEFAAANPTNANLKEALSLVNFNAYLIQDGYTLDFRRDFHEFSETKDFFSTPSWYKGETGLGKFFSNPELFEFKSSFLRPEAGYLPAGKYNIKINIDYNNNCWCLFENTTPDAKIEVIFERLDTPKPDSVFYYMPFDGLIGVDSQNGRQGYGVNYRQKSEETVKINEDIRQPVRTTTIANSVPIPGGWIEARVVKDFKTLHNDAPGVVLELEKAASGISMIYSPSVVTPIILKVSGGERTKAYVFYQLTINGKPQEASSNLFTWAGVTKGCKDFSDVDVTEAFNYKRDIRGGVGRTQCAGSFDTHQYGIEWCNVIRKGDTFLKTVLYTPQESTALLEIVSAMDSASFITPKGTGNRVEAGGLEETIITSIEKILRLVEEKKICIAGAGSDSRAIFFWNQQEIINSSLKNTIESIPSQCIKD
ncbi:MAG: hypothetical protein QXM75_00675 [Candidatus Diapherotrites archaeon]